MEVVAQRVFEPFYMWLDIAFLVVFAGLLLYKKKYTTVIVGSLPEYYIRLLITVSFTLLPIHVPFLRGTVSFGCCCG